MKEHCYGCVIIAFAEKTIVIIEDYSKSLSLPLELVSEAKLIAEKSIRNSIALGYKPEELAAASIYVACRARKIPLTFREVAKFTNVNRVKLGNLYKKIITMLDIKIPLPNPEDFITKRLAPLLGISSDIVSKALDIIKNIKNRGILAGKNPSAVAAAAVLIASRSLKQPVKISRLARVSGVTVVTVKNIAKSLTRTIETSTQ